MWLVLFPPMMLVDVVGMANALEALAMDAKTRLSTDIEVGIGLVPFIRALIIIHCSRTLFFG